MIKLAKISPFELLDTFQQCLSKFDTVSHRMTQFDTEWHRIDTKWYNLTQNDSNIHRDV